MVRGSCCDKMGLKKGPWSAEEDRKLIAYIRQHGHGNWRALPKQAGLLRCGKSCRLRWTNYLRPDVKRGNFTPAEEQTIIKLHHIVGNRWSIIASFLQGRTDNEIKNAWNTRLKKRLTEEEAAKYSSSADYQNVLSIQNWSSNNFPEISDFVPTNSEGVDGSASYKALGIDKIVEDENAAFPQQIEQLVPCALGSPDSVCNSSNPSVSVPGFSVDVEISACNTSAISLETDYNRSLADYINSVKILLDVDEEQTSVCQTSEGRYCENLMYENNHDGEEGSLLQLQQQQLNDCIDYDSILTLDDLLCSQFIQLESTEESAQSCSGVCDNEEFFTALFSSADECDDTKNYQIS
uniref:Uncharacterized protein n=1 Tax=Araucaria cunninghamii TaxID=56994 RepID=A0A0D6QWR7_ARACU